MSVSFAPVHSPARSFAARVIRPGRLPTPSNDDGDDQWDALGASLRHFAIHGLGAARAACADAEVHWHRGDHKAMERSLALCRAFDKRLARRIEARLMEAAVTIA